MPDLLPEPLTPPDCDLRAFRDMPLDVQRFRDSDLLTDEEPEVVLAALFLWTAAWHQVPAASLPNNDRALAKFAGYGRSDTAWRAVREGALRGFVLCQDGRLYHRVLAQKALGAWRKRLEREFSLARDRHRKDQRKLPESERREFPDLDEWLASRALGCKPDAMTFETAKKRQPELPLETTDLSTEQPSERAPPRSERARTGATIVPSGFSGGNGHAFPRKDAAIPAETALKGREGKGVESTQLDSPHSLPGASEPDAGDESSCDDNLLANADLLTLYEAVCDAAGHHPISPQRIAKAQDIVKGWRDAGYDFDLIVIPTIRHVVAETSEPTRTLHRFRDRIHHEAAKLKATPRGRYKPPPSPILEPEDEEPEFRDMRLALLDRLGPAAYSMAANKIRFERITDVPENRCPVLKVNSLDRMNGQPAILEGVYRSVLRNLAMIHGFKEVW